jgi:hypothetical protein
MEAVADAAVGCMMVSCLYCCQQGSMSWQAKSRLMLRSHVDGVDVQERACCCCSVVVVLVIDR